MDQTKVEELKHVRNAVVTHLSVKQPGTELYLNRTCSVQRYLFTEKIRRGYGAGTEGTEKEPDNSANGLFCFPQYIEATCAKEIPQVRNGRNYVV